jgi:hypothetical protein
MKLRCITLHQPWAQWVALGWKTIETRTHARFAGLVDERIGICAAQKWDDSALRAARPFLTAQKLAATRAFRRHQSGALLCTVVVDGADWLARSGGRKALIECHTTRRFGLFLRDVRAIGVGGAIPVRGQQGIFSVELPKGLLAA